MRSLFLIASALLGASGVAQVMPDADRLAQRRAPRRIVPRRAPGNAPAPVAVPQRLEDGGAGRETDPARCIEACDRTMRACNERCPAMGSHNCERPCFMAHAQCILQCPGDAAAMVFATGLPPRDPNQPVLRNVPRRQ